MKFGVKNITYASRRAAFKDHRRCEAQVLDSTARWRVRAGKDFQCELGALFWVDGKLLCKRHAGDYCLELLVKGEYVIGENK